MIRNVNIMGNLMIEMGSAQGKRPSNYYLAATACYLAHVECGQSIRAIAVKMNLHPSTVMRRVRKIEMMRDDPLVDQFLTTQPPYQAFPITQTESCSNMSYENQSFNSETTPQYRQEEIRILRRLCETGAFLAVSKSLTKAVVMRTNARGEQTRTAVVESRWAGAMVLKDWVHCTKSGEIARYEVTPAGRAALKRFMADISLKQSPQGGFSEVPSLFSEQHKEWGERKVIERGAGTPRQLRVNLRESPLSTLGRKKGKDGAPFLSVELMAAGERFREDFELSQIGPRVAQNWDRFLTPRDAGSVGSGGGGLSSAQERFSAALHALGPGLGDIAMRCCCFLEGLEAAEKRMGWSARSGKIVLRIALQRLSVHYTGPEADQLRKIG